MVSEFDIEAVEALLRLDLMSFVHRCFYELNPGQEFSEARHLAYMCAKLANCLTGRGPKRLIINLPPRSLKSITVSVAAVAWLLGLDPAKQIICASYGQDLADKHARDTRTLMQSAFYRRLFPWTRLSQQKQSVHDFMTTEQGFRMATSVGGVLTGRGADIIILDDPLKPDDALSEPRRTAVNDWYDNTLLSRLNHKQEGIIVIVMQRLHQDDLVGHVLDRGEEWDVVSFPAIAEQDEDVKIESLVGPVRFRRRVGEVLDPVRESRQTLEKLKVSLGQYNFASQFQQDPTPQGGALLKPEWLHYYEPEAPLPEFVFILQSWDTANKAGELNDFSVCTTWGYWNRTCYLLDVVRMRVDYPGLKQLALLQIEMHQPHRVLIEDKASGTQLIQDLQASGVYEVTPYVAPPGNDKIMRLYAQSAKFESGQVRLPRKAAWLDLYLRELLGFPGTKFDDQVDSTTQALDHLAQGALSIYDAL